MNTQLPERTEYAQNRIWRSTDKLIGQIARKLRRTKVQVIDMAVWDLWQKTFEENEDE
jgi:hypothetical protein